MCDVHHEVCCAVLCRSVVYLGSPCNLSMLGLHLLNSTEEVCLGQGHAPYCQVLLSLPTQHRVHTSKPEVEHETASSHGTPGGRGMVSVGGVEGRGCEWGQVM